MIKIQNLTKKYNNLLALNNVSFNIKKGEKIALVGSNGAGKTTLIETIIGITKPSKGKVIFDFDYTKSPLEKFGVQFQDSKYPEGLTTMDIINFFNEVGIKQLSQSEIDKMLKLFDMESFLYSGAHSLSGGEKQKLNVFLAFISTPEIIFLDELTTGLDLKVRKKITNFVQNYLETNNSTLILVSHNETEIKLLCERIIVMKDGIIAYDNSLKQAEKEYKSIENLMGKYI